MADRTIGLLPQAPDLYDDSRIVIEQQGASAHITGAQLKSYARAGVSEYVESARDAAQKAQASAESAAGSAATARQYSGKPPIIQDGRWWTWNAEKQVYVDTGEAARGNLMYATFFVDAADGTLYMVTDAEYTGPGFRLTDGKLEVVLDNGNAH